MRQKALKIMFLNQFPMKSPVCNNLPCSQTLFYHFAFVPVLLDKISLSSNLVQLFKQALCTFLDWQADSSSHTILFN